jgi:hypothetical protein
MSDWVTPEMEEKMDKIKIIWNNDPYLQQLRILVQHLKSLQEAIPLIEKCVKEKSKNRLISEVWIDPKTIEERKNKPVGTNYQIYTNQVIKQKRNKKRQFKESLIGVELEKDQERKIHWTQFLDKKK